MVAIDEAAEYLAEIREQVCSRCVERPPGGPPCAPLGKSCGIELHLPQLVDSIRGVQSSALAPYLDHNRNEICQTCALLHSSACPCPMDYLAALVVEAVETVDQRHEAVAGASRSMTLPDDLDEIAQAFAQASGQWTGCDWPTRFGESGLNLAGMTPMDAWSMMEKTQGTSAPADWQSAARWLDQVRHHAACAEAAATSALRCAQSGDWPAAKRHAEHAWLLEFTTGRPLRRPGEPTWLRFREAIVRAYRTRMLDGIELGGGD
jgi:hypothetical protein